MAWNLKEFNTVVLPLVKARLTSAKTISLDVSSEAGRQGGTVDVQSPYVQGEANVHTQANRDAKDGFIFDDVVDQSTPITLSDYVYKGTELPYDFVTFTIVDLKEIANQAANVVARKINSITANLFQTEINAAVTPVTLAATDKDSAAIILKSLLRAKTTLDTAGVDTFNRSAVVSPLVGEILLGSEQFSNADKAGNADSLREATIGRVYGFDVIVDNNLTDYGMVAYENYGFGLVVRPKGKSVSNAVESEVTMDDAGTMVLNSTAAFDSNSQSDKLVVGAFVGAAKLDPSRSVAVKFTAAV